MRVPDPRAPIAFKPLEMVDPRTRKPITPDTMITLANRRQITAAKYYEQMNQLEAGLNKLGHSFRDQQKEIVTNEVVVDKEKILSQIRSTRFSPPNRRTAAAMERLDQANREYVRTVNPYFGKMAPRGFSPKVRGGLYQERVDGAIVVPRGPTTMPTTRPDFLPGDGMVVYIDHQIENMPGIDSDPAWAEDGKLVTGIQVNASWSPVAFYVNYVEGAFRKPKVSAPLAPKYIWQLVKAGPSRDNLGSFAKNWATEFDKQEFVNWQNPPGLVQSGEVNFLSNKEDSPFEVQKRHLFEINFAGFVGAPPNGPPVDYLVRVVPVNRDGSIAGYPSRPVLVSYGAHPELAPKEFHLPPTPPAKIKSNNVARQDAPTSFGDPNVMSIKLNSWAESNGSPGKQFASIGFDSECSVYGRQFTLLRVTAHGDLIPTQLDGAGNVVINPGFATAGVSILVGGFEVCPDCTRSGPGAQSIPFDKSTSFDESFTLSFPLGPIDVSATIGVRGEIGVGGTVSLAPSGSYPFNISAGPHLSIAIYLEADAGIGVGGFDVAEVGVEGNVNLISASFRVSFSLNDSGSGHYYGRVSDLSLFSGTLNAYAKAGYCPLCKKWTTTLYSWEGYNLLTTNPERATLFEGSF